jgi:hypothetical protein
MPDEHDEPVVVDHRIVADPWEGWDGGPLDAQRLQDLIDGAPVEHVKLLAIEEMRTLLDKYEPALRRIPEDRAELIPAAMTADDAVLFGQLNRVLDGAVGGRHA